jgi:2-polyprenyl-6-methoxyphenol hydroxylase-like FAD-dependent oxidoreductase
VEAAVDADVIVIGSRAAGAATALLLARDGLRVIAVDRAHFPSDTLSSHQLQLPGAACLLRWGLLERLTATGVPPTRELRFDPGPAVLRTTISEYDGVAAMYSPRRTVLDALLVDAARESGAEVIEGFDAGDFVMDAGRVTGVRGRLRSGPVGAERTLTAPLVIGADGKHSTTAKAVGAREYHRAPAQSAACYAYWDGLDVAGGEMYARDRRMVGAWPTNDGLTVTFVGLPANDFDAFRADSQAAVLASLDLAGDLGERARSATRVEQIRATNDLPHLFRTPGGPGWALVGDAGLVMDPITGQGIGHALQDAESLAEAVTAGLGGAQPLDQALASYGRRRDARRFDMHQMTADLASFAPAPGADVLFGALAENPEAMGGFFAVLAGIESPRSFFAPGHLRRILGWRRMIAMMRAGRPPRVKLT